MPHNVSGELPLSQVDDLNADNVAAFIMARAFAEIYTDANERPLPEPLADILQQAKRLGDQA